LRTQLNLFKDLNDKSVFSNFLLDFPTTTVILWNYQKSLGD